MPSRSTNSVQARAVEKDPPVQHDISVIIPTVGRSILERCLGSLADGSQLPGQIIVIDQGSEPKIGLWLEELEGLGVETKHMPSSQTGKASAVNRGIECADTEFIAITDDDCLVAPDWLRNMRAHLEKLPNTVVTGRVEAAGDEEVPVVVTSVSPATYSRPRLKFDTLSGGNMGVARAVMNRVGLLDEELRCSEDGEWAYRALRAGVQIKYAPDVVVYHYGWRDTTERRLRYREYAEGCGRFYGKYLRQGDWFIGLRTVVHYLREVRRYLRSAVGRDAEMLRRSWACLRWLPPGIVAGFLSREGVVARVKR
jgi:GT2 family glycosyltransferase